MSLNQIDPREYQIDTAATLYENQDQSYIVNMPVGGGKTETAIEALAAAGQEHEDYGALVVLPDRRVEKQWYDRMQDNEIEALLDVERNPKKDTTPIDNEKTHFRYRDDGAGAIKERKQRIQDWEQQQRNDKSGIFTGDNVVLTTYQLLDSDITHDRVDGRALEQYNDIIVDEATNVVARDAAVGEQTDNSYRQNEYFATMFEELDTALDEPRYIGLTALVGDRTQAVAEELDADLLRPDIEAVNAYRPDLEQVDPHLAYDQPLLHLIGALDEREENTGHALKTMLKEEGHQNPSVGSSALQQYAERDDEIGALSQKIFQYRAMKSRLQEATSGALQPFEDDVAQLLGEAGIDQPGQLLGEAFENATRPGEDPQRDAIKQSEEYHHEDHRTDWSTLFPTMKELGVHQLHEQFQEQDHQSLVFVRHRATAEDLPNILPGDTAVMTGGTGDQDQRDIIDAYHDGDLDTIAMTYSLGAEGLDFGTADHVVLMGEPRTVEEHHNAVGRIRRGDGPKWEHALINYSGDHEFRYEQYLDFVENEDPVESIPPEPSDHERDAIELMLEAE